MCVNFCTDYIDSEPSDFEHLLQISRLHYSGYKSFVLVIFSTIEYNNIQIHLVFSPY